jgi:AcrR family transcriptional regulator
VPDAVPRGRHAPPIEVRLGVQRARLFAAAAEVFCRSGYADATAGAIAAEAGMSKATFYEHFANKEECILALFDEAVTEVARAAGGAAQGLREASYEFRVRAGIRALLAVVAEHPRTTQTLLVEIIGAGPRAAERRDAVLQDFADLIDHENATAAELYGVPRLHSPDDAYALVGAIVELASRQLRHGRPADALDLEPVVERLISGLLAATAAGR